MLYISLGAANLGISLAQNAGRLRTSARARARDGAGQKRLAALDGPAQGRLRREVRKALLTTPQLATHTLSFFADRTLVFLAAWRGRLRVVRLLADAGAHLAKKRRLPLHTA